MGIGSRISQFYHEYYQYDKFTEFVNRRDYFNMISVFGLYPGTSKYLPLKLLQILLSFLLQFVYIILFIICTIIFVEYNFTMATFMFQVSVFVIISLLLLVFLNFKRGLYRRLHREMVYEHFKYEYDDIDLIDGLLLENYKEKKRLAALPIGIALAGVITIVARPIIDSNYGEMGFDPREVPINFNMPIPCPFPEEFDSGTPWTVGFLTQTILALNVVSIIGIICFTFINLSQYMCFHLRHLLHNIVVLDVRAERLFRTAYPEEIISGKGGNRLLFDDPRYMECYEKCLIITIRHHQRILSWVRTYQNLTSVLIGMAYLLSTAAIAMSLLAIKTGSSLPGTLLASMVFCCVDSGFMLLLSVFGQRITDLSEEIPICLYGTNWFLCTKKVNRLLFVIQLISQKPIKILCLGFIPANLETFKNVMNSAYTYYNMIMAV